MDKLREELQKRIDQVTRKLVALRDEYDRLDANHPSQSVQVARDIASTSEMLSSMIKFQNLIEGE